MEIPCFPPVEPHQRAMMEETERWYQERIGADPELYEKEMRKHREAIEKYPMLARNGRKAGVRQE